MFLLAGYERDPQFDNQNASKYSVQLFYLLKPKEAHFCEMIRLRSVLILSRLAYSSHLV